VRAKRPLPGLITAGNVLLVPVGLYAHVFHLQVGVLCSLIAPKIHVTLNV